MGPDFLFCLILEYQIAIPTNPPKQKTESKVAQMPSVSASRELKVKDQKGGSNQKGTVPRISKSTQKASKPIATQNNARSTAAGRKRSLETAHDDQTSTTTSGISKRVKTGSIGSKEPTKLAIINNAPTAKLTVLVFGGGEMGELGLGPKKNEALRPTRNPHLSAFDVVQVACGGMHTVALTSDNKIITWGVNDENALGRDTQWDGKLRDMDAASEDDEDDEDMNPLESTPMQIPSDCFPPHIRFVQVAAGDSCSFALTDTGQVYGWGTFRVSIYFASKPSYSNLVARTLGVIKVLGITNVESWLRTKQDQSVSKISKILLRFAVALTMHWRLISEVIFGPGAVMSNTNLAADLLDVPLIPLHLIKFESAAIKPSISLLEAITALQLTRMITSGAGAQTISVKPEMLKRPAMKGHSSRQLSLLVFVRRMSWS